MSTINHKNHMPSPEATASQAAHEDDEDDREAIEQTDWRQHLPPELAALMNDGTADAEAVVGTKSAAKARRRLMELVKTQEQIEKAQRKERAQDRALRAARAIAARKLNGWDQEEAARRLGYANSTQLSLLESCSREINLDHVMRFADVYRVSTDFLLGRTPTEVELDARRLAASRVEDGLRHIAGTLMAYIGASDCAIGGPTVETVRALVTHTRAVSSAMARIDGPALDSVKGGTTLAFAIEQLEEAAMDAARAITGYDGEVQRLRDLLRTSASNDAAA
ncbi:helix-turn-helix transcriptional regulator [Variovorax ureilyticus]|uniref:Helix-turn-helix transcriptional regulator n=1 Tax=Variovorax ureilyticus TaxID=1836198 RepID=A0ABU8VDS8_9BURK